jgi:UDP:flavonoid glycosyltransferase YjiC (YdhE family)
MARIALANEMGGGWGHLLPLRSIAEGFLQQGCEVILLCRDARKAQDAFAGIDVAVEPSPAWSMPRYTGFSLNYAQNLWRNGYRDTEKFGAHFTWWLTRFRALKPAFVFTDYAPTALLAAHSLGTPRGAMGTGFTLPPMTTPMPCLHPWIQSPDEALLETEDRVLGTIKHHVPSVRSVAGIFEGAARFLLVFPEMDHFEIRASEKYLGPVFGPSRYHESARLHDSEHRVFVYLSAANRCLSDLMNHLRRLGLPGIGHIRDFPECERKSLQSPTLRLSKTLVNLDRAAAECDIAVTQGGLHTSARMLLSGARLLICPEQLEQTLLAYRLKQRGLCEFVSFFKEAHTVKERLEIVLSSSELGNRAATFASKHAGYNPVNTIREIVLTCLNAM